MYDYKLYLDVIGNDAAAYDDYFSEKLLGLFGAGAARIVERRKRTIHPKDGTAILFFDAEGVRPANKSAVIETAKAFFRQERPVLEERKITAGILIIARPTDGTGERYILKANKDNVLEFPDKGDAVRHPIDA